MYVLIASIHYPPFSLYIIQIIIRHVHKGQNYHFFSLVTVLIEIVPSHLHSHNNLSNGASSQVLPATLAPQ
jgi:hypothetical protein